MTLRIFNSMTRKNVAELVTLARVLGLLEAQGREPATIDPQLKVRIESLVHLRGEARGRREFSEADRLREEISRLGVVIEDTPHGTNWRLSS